MAFSPVPDDVITDVDVVLASLRDALPLGVTRFALRNRCGIPLKRVDPAADELVRRGLAVRSLVSYPVLGVAHQLVPAFTAVRSGRPPRPARDFVAL